jgi:hypothetical protein
MATPRGPPASTAATGTTGAASPSPTGPASPTRSTPTPASARHADREPVQPWLSRRWLRQYLAGLRAGGWRGGDAEVRRAIAVTGAAKYCWLAPRMLARLADGGAPGPYDRRGADQVLAGRAGVLTLVATWGRQALT